jgi:ubiquinone/menaquinone biosynthesis C-methylase UbiE/broad specificity phosphatase PhoE
VTVWKIRYYASNDTGIRHEPFVTTSPGNTSHTKSFSPDHLSAAAPEIRLLLITHAEGLQNRYTDLLLDGPAVADGGLTALGWEQTNQLAQWLVTHETIDALYSAPLLRSRLTAQRLGQALNLGVSVQDGLPGRFADGMSLPGVWDRSVRTINQRPTVQYVEPGTLYGAYAWELVEALDSIVQENWGKSVAIVLSGNGVATAVRHFFGAHALAVAVCHTGITELRRHEGLWQLVYLNRREHWPLPAQAAYRQKVEPVAGGNGDEHSADLAAVARAYNRLVPTVAEARGPEPEGRLRHLLKFAQLRPDLSVIDVGSGSGALAIILAEEGAREVVGVDTSPAMLETAELLRLQSASANVRRVSFRLAPAHALPFRDERFDVAICRLLLSHSHRPQDILEEVTRLLKHGGLLVLADLLSVDDAVKRATQNAIEEKRNPSHVAARSADQYRKLVTGAGLVIEGEQTVTFERELDEWMSDMQADQASRTLVREMIEAGLETDAAGLTARRRGDKIFFEQRLFYLKARKP